MPERRQERDAQRDEGHVGDDEVDGLGEVEAVASVHALARDHPWIGPELPVELAFADVERLLEVLHRLVDAGNTVVVIEHNLDVVKTADWIIDLGPEGGKAGGEVIAEGTPEAVARSRRSFTGRYLRELLATGEVRGIA